MLINTGIAENDEVAGIKVDQALASGKAAEVFGKMIHVLGGPADFIEQPWQSMTKANVITEVVAPKHGYISDMQTRDIGMAIVELGGGRLANDQKIDHSVGFDRILPVGTLVNRGDVVARLHANCPDSAKQAAKQYLSALSIEELEPKATPVIYQTLDAQSH